MAAGPGHRSRRRTQQRAPSAGLDLRGFPSTTTPARRPWFRCHVDRPAQGRDRGAWFFSSSPADGPAPASGRFDLPEPEGTCYLASTPGAAVRELAGPDVVRRGWIEGELLEGRVVSKLTLRHPVRAADVSARRATDYRISAELTTTSRYEVTQAWARALRDAGFDALRHQLRFTPGSDRGLALFGPAGRPEPVRRGDEDPAPAAAWARSLGLDVVTAPSSAAVEIVPP